MYVQIYSIDIVPDYTHTICLKVPGKKTFSWSNFCFDYRLQKLSKAAEVQQLIRTCYYKWSPQTRKVAQSIHPAIYEASNIIFSECCLTLNCQSSESHRMKWKFPQRKKSPQCLEVCLQLSVTLLKYYFIKYKVASKYKKYTVCTELEMYMKVVDLSIFFRCF